MALGELHLRIGVKHKWLLFLVNIPALFGFKAIVPKMCVKASNRFFQVSPDNSESQVDNKINIPPFQSSELMW